MSRRENVRAAVLATAHLRTNKELAGSLELSVRQVQRLKKALREEGPAGLAHGNRGCRAAHGLAEDVRKRVVELYSGKYRGFNFSHFHEKLAEVEGIVVCRSTVGRVLRAAGYGSPKKRRGPKHRSRRERRQSEGAMLQLDGSPHDWLEGRGPRLCLVGAIDDATGKVPAAVFRDYEDAQGYFLLMRWIVKKYGIPQSVYRDRHTIFERDPKEGDSIQEQLEGRRSPTQFGRLLEELGVGQIAANSAQAKGRVERLWGTLQDRLVSELRLANASTIDEANEVLKRVIAEHNMRFHRLPGDPQSLYRKLDKAQDPERLFCFKYKRSVARDNTVTFFSRTVQIAPGPGGRSYAGRWVDVHECFDGSLHVYHDGNCLAKTAAPAVPPSVIRVRHANGRYTQECPWTAPPQTKPSQNPAAHASKPEQRQPYKPAPDHPWRRTWVTKSQTTKG